jgi:hypothetical protein
MNANEKQTEATPRRRRQPVRQSLTSLAGIIAEATKVYRQARAGKIDHKEARSLVWMLGEIRQMVEAQQLEKIEARLAELGEAADIGSGRGERSPAFGAALH